jgi:hypothetical protein
MRAAICCILFAASAAATQPMPKRTALPSDDPQASIRVAMPQANPPGGLFTDSLDVTLIDATPGAAIFYTLDGTYPDSSVGEATHLYAGPLRLRATTVIRARAIKSNWLTSDIMGENYFLMPPLYGLRGWYQDQDGDGRVEKAVVEFTLDLPALPDRLAFTLDHGGVDTAVRIAAGAALAFSAGSHKRVVASFSEPFPAGWTSAPGQGTAARIFAQADPPLVEQTLPLSDSTGPVAVRAIVYPRTAGAPYAQVVVAFSEPLHTSGSFQNSVFRKKADGTTGYLASMTPVLAIESPAGLSLSTDTSGTPALGDSVALSNEGEITDLSFNVPHHLHWIAVEAGIPTALAPPSQPGRRAGRGKIGRYRRGNADFDAKGIQRPQTARLP